MVRVDARMSVVRVVPVLECTVMMWETVLRQYFVELERVKLHSSDTGSSFQCQHDFKPTFTAEKVTLLGEEKLLKLLQAKRNIV